MNKEHIDELVTIWAEDRNFFGEGGATLDGQLDKLFEECNELDEAIAAQDYDAIVDALGDIQVVHTILCEMLELDPTACYKEAYNQIKNRTGEFVDGVFVKDLDL